ncbi:NPCBM/NEW2 domain-containing protein [Anaerococcus vaginalis]|uniref:NPCBM/NEW2 domain-containing protein n=1 Tax=Anaerococcus vaginalis TaxID=33037 RepID=UPI00290F9E04|nr:NPCBM/NEW2 domain-containing protein [Anaerococcus vaginalis]MDU6547716.1 NPCBM/NEW2 domain-containing protein [Anaerococcus vaginalis]
MKKNKICIILFSLLFLNGCVSQNFNMSQGDNNKNQTAHEEKSAQNNQSNSDEEKDKDKINKNSKEKSEDNKSGKNIGDTENSKTDLYLGTDIEPFAQYYYSDSDNLANMGGVHYKNFFSLYNNSGDEYCSFNLKGEYKTLEGKIGNIDGSDQYDFAIDIYGDNKKLASCSVSSAELPTDISIDVSGVKNLKFEIGDGSDSKYPYYIGFADMKLKK